MSTRPATFRASGRLWAGTLIVLLVSALAPPADAFDAERVRSSLEALLAQGGPQARSQDPRPYGQNRPHRAQDGAFDRATLATLYGHRNYQPLWIVNGRLSRQATALLQTLRAAGDFGLLASDYQGEQLTEEFARLEDDPSTDASLWAPAELALSTAALRFVTHLHFGRIDPLTAGFDTPVMPPVHIDRGALLGELATAPDPGAILARVEPGFRHYRLLKEALVRYRELASQPGLTSLPPLPRRIVRQGEAYAGTQPLRRLLEALGDLPRTPDDPAQAPGNPAARLAIVDPSLAQAVKHFQNRHGLRADGVIDQKTFAALTTPLPRRVRQIELTLERWRWLPGFGTPPIIVNIPQFRLFALRTSSDTESEMLQMEVIVGQTFRRMRTPIFAADMKYVVFRPYWDVPFSIMSREILPHLHTQPGYLVSRHLEIVRGAGDDALVLLPTPENIAALASGSLRLRQRPGADNALGLVKFMLPNRYNVYLHSTPSPDLFNEPRRAFSHGCIRVSDPVALAAYVLRNARRDWTAAKIAAAMKGPTTSRVNLPSPIPVMILYGTAVASEAGNILFFEDLYGHDAHLEKLLGLKPLTGVAQ
jgi:murein L,D-transpeptidase YcbB/YkuD